MLNRTVSNQIDVEFLAHSLFLLHPEIVYSLFVEYFKSIVLSIALGFEDEYFLSGSADMTVRLWNANSKEQLLVYKGHTMEVTSVLFTSDMEKALSGSCDGTIKVWSIKKKPW